MVSSLKKDGQPTPPAGINVYAICTAARDVPMQTVFKDILPFFFCQMILLGTFTLFSDLMTFLPRLLLK